MKRLVIRVLLFLLTFSLGVLAQTLLVPRAPVKEETPIIQTPEPIVKIVRVPIPAASPAPVLILDYDPKKFEPYGYYGIIGRRPNQFSEVDSIALDVYEGENGPTGTMIIGTVEGVGQRYDSEAAVFGLLTQERVFFVTKTFDSGFEYRFEGVFLHKKVPSAWAGTDKPLIRGTLTKSKNGRKIAEAVVNLRLEHFGC
jgi:hypothetical protein